MRCVRTRSPQVRGSSACAGSGPPSRRARRPLVGRPEVDAAPDACIDDLVQSVRETIPAPRLAREHAEGAGADLVRAEEMLRVHDCAARTAVRGGMIREGRRGERWAAPRRPGIEQRRPVRVAVGARIAVEVALADRRDRAPAPTACGATFPGVVRLGRPARPNAGAWPGGSPRCGCRVFNRTGRPHRVRLAGGSEAPRREPENRPQ
jgi:hypothetical protein